MMINVGIVGWRGIVGSVLLKRLSEENDFVKFNPFFFSTSKIGEHDLGESYAYQNHRLRDAYNFEELSNMGIIISCQGSKYTKYVHVKLRKNGWQGYWIDTSSELRLKDNSIIVLDPINGMSICEALSNGVLDYIGGNCTVSLMLMATYGLIKSGWVDWITSMTYQAISGAGVNKIKELILQINSFSKNVSNVPINRAYEFVNIDKKNFLKSNESSLKQCKSNIPIITNLTPWIGSTSVDGQTEEEWKGSVETNKILGLAENDIIPVDGQCVRTDVIRCHSQALTLKLKEDISLEEIEKSIKLSTKWTTLIPNNKEDTLKSLNPFSVSGSLNILVGRVRKLKIGPKYLTMFTVGDQLLWGAAEPVRRVLNMILKHISIS